MNKYWIPVEGETPLDDMSGLKVRLSNPTRSVVGELEARNIQKGTSKYLVKNVSMRNAPFDLPWLQKLHKEMFGEVWDWAGKFRTTDKSVGVPKEQIQIQLLQLLADLKAWPDIDTDMDYIEQAARLHHRSVQIHPFENGNGRWSRMLTNIWLRLHKQPVTMWPVTVDAESPIRGRYLESLKKADDMDYKDFILLHRDYGED